MVLACDIYGADVLRPEGLSKDPLSFADGAITDALVGRSVDLSGFRVFPGLVDVHGDGFERHVAPRRGAMKDVGEGLFTAERELAVNGITTGVLAQFLSWEGGLRGSEFAHQVFGALRELRDQVVTDLRGQLRLETHLMDVFDTLPDRLVEWGLTYVVFNDHLPHDRLATGRTLPRLRAQALKAGRSPEQHLEIMQMLHAQSAEVPDALDWLCTRLKKQGVRMGSHDDQTPTARTAWRQRGVTVAEFPETTEAAESARTGGDLIVMGAPNVMRGGSHNGNISALDLIAMGLCDALASDYHYPSMRRAALLVARSGLMDLAAAWALVSRGPARVLGLEDRGELKPGLRADFVVLDVKDRVAATIAGGRVSYVTGEVAERFVRG